VSHPVLRMVDGLGRSCIAYDRLGTIRIVRIEGKRRLGFLGSSWHEFHIPFKTGGLWRPQPRGAHILR
jgi:hypothetical protein